MNGEPLTDAGAGFVIAMLVMMALSFAMIGGLFVCMVRNAGRRDRHVDELLEEIADEEKREKQAEKIPAPPLPEPWERDGDWWRK